MTKIAGSGSGSISRRHGSADPDPYQNVTDPQYCITGTGKHLHTATIRYTLIFSSRTRSKIEHSLEPFSLYINKATKKTMKKYQNTLCQLSKIYCKQTLLSGEPASKSNITVKRVLCEYVVSLRYLTRLPCSSAMIVVCI